MDVSKKTAFNIKMMRKLDQKVSRVAQRLNQDIDRRTALSPVNVDAKISDSVELDLKVNNEIRQINIENPENRIPPQIDSRALVQYDPQVDYGHQNDDQSAIVM